jgi:hypothetical protein
MGAYVGTHAAFFGCLVKGSRSTWLEAMACRTRLGRTALCGCRNSLPSLPWLAGHGLRSDAAVQRSFHLFQKSDGAVQVCPLLAKPCQLVSHRSIIRCW